MPQLIQHISLPTAQPRAALNQFSGTISALALHPGGFYAKFPPGREFMAPVVFLLSCSLLYTALASIFVVREHAFFAAVFFLNSFGMPFMVAFILYLIAAVVCKNTFAYKNLFGIAAYANVTLLLAWIPGLSWITGIWSFYLIGLGMVKAGRIKGWKAGICLLTALAIMLALIKLIQPLLRI